MVQQFGNAKRAGDFATFSVQTNLDFHNSRMLTRTPTGQFS
jgi:hypothetical protein